MVDDFNRYLKRATTVGFTIGIVLVSIMFIGISYFVWGESQDRQIQPWLEIFPQNVLSHLVDSDYHPVSSKIRLIQKTKLFDKFAVYDSNGDWIDGFGVTIVNPLNKSQATPIKDESGNVWGWYVYEKDTSEQFVYLKLISVSTILLILFVIVLIQIIFNKFVATKVARFSDFIDSIDEISNRIKNTPEEEFANQVFNPQNTLEFKEAKLLNSSIINLINEIQNSKQKHFQSLIESEKNKSLSEIATQVAHDIRSPLEVLKSIDSDLQLLPIDSKRRILLSISRIEEIAYNLLKTHKQSLNSNKEIQSEELLGLLKSVILEKKIEFRNRSTVEIIEDLDTNSYGLFSNIQRISLKNIVSNLVNNGIESFEGNPGKIEIALESRINFNVITLSDNGSGIIPTTREKLFTKGFTTKKTGNGLGLYNAKQDIEAVGGTIVCESEIGKGTTFIITLPKSETPLSFIASIDAYKYERIIVLDDDPAFHEVWNKRLEGLESKVEHIHSVEEMLSKYQVLHPKILLLSDFELMDKHLDGIDTILKLKHSEHSVLVTARNEEQAIQDRCLKAGIKLLPKSLVNYVMVRTTGMPMVTGREGIGEGLDLVREPSESSKHIDASKLESASMVGESVAGFASAGEAFGMYLEGGVSRNGDKPEPKASKFGHVEGTQGREVESCTLHVDHADRRSSNVQDGKNQKPSSAGEKYGIYIQGGQARNGGDAGSGSGQTSIILIDDDRLVHLNWKSHCKKNGFEFTGFMSIKDFMAASASFDQASKIYIDSNLGDGIKGEVESEKIFALGFLNLYLATGYEKDSIQKPAWIKEVFSKSPENIG